MLVYMALIDDQQYCDRFEELYLQYRHKMLFVAYTILDDTFEAEDAVHEAFLAIARNMSNLEHMDQPAVVAYLVKAARSRALNMANKRKRDDIVFLTDAQVEELSDREFWEKLEMHDNFDRVVQAILDLDPVYRDVLSMYFLHEATTREIARALGRKESTVRQQVIRGRKMLLRNLQREEGTYDESKEPAVRRKRYSKKSRS